MNGKCVRTNLKNELPYANVLIRTTLHPFPSFFVLLPQPLPQPTTLNHDQPPPATTTSSEPPSSPAIIPSPLSFFLFFPSFLSVPSPFAHAAIVAPSPQPPSYPSCPIPSSYLLHCGCYNKGHPYFPPLFRRINCHRRRL
ncbi:uncharacterized protein DS421_6g186480 [Arachis hypogaea]|nr:uncharacterized protein DS421_6g186480 [Arachis hypogaea]